MVHLRKGMALLLVGCVAPLCVCVATSRAETGVLVVRVFHDLDGNGIYGAWEGLGDIGVIVTDAQSHANEFRTDPNGYVYTVLPAGDVEVDIVDSDLPAGLILVVGTDPSTVTVPAAGSVSDNNGYEILGSLEVWVFQDFDGNGACSEDEGLGGVEVVARDRLSRTIKLWTDTSGQAYTSILTGDVEIDITDAHLPTGAVLTVGTDPSTVTVPAQGMGTCLKGYEVHGTLQARVLNDLNGNGVYDAGEGLTNVSVVTKDGLGRIASTLTDSNGYAFVSVLEGYVEVDVTDTDLPKGAVLTLGSDPNMIDIRAGETVSDDNIYELRGDLELWVFEDYDGDGAHDFGEGLRSVKVVITDGLSRTLELWTDSSGYAYAPLLAGNVEIDVTDADLPGGLVLTVGTDPSTVAVPAGGAAIDTNGYRAEGVLEVYVFNDFDGDGVCGIEEGLADVKVSTKDDQGRSTTLVTDPNGYAAVHTLAGDVEVDVTDTDLPAGAILTVGSDPSTVTVPPRGSVLQVNGYELHGTLTVHVFHDLDGNGIDEPSEWLADVGVAAVDRLGRLTVLKTDLSGYASAQVRAGDVEVDIQDTDLPAGALITVGTDPSTVTVPAAGLAFDDNGCEVQGWLEVRVFSDRNVNGAYDEGEGMADVEVVTTDDLGRVVVFTTDTNGYFGAWMLAGDLEVDVVDTDLPAGAVLTEGSDPNTVIITVGGVVSDVNGYEVRGTLILLR